ncbi:uncharacterized protein [Prorops nasuta]|uniref:uncharacterized protein isoform X1 n=1 Tax=Prorops nasuta TaxID=863751 RepID=UPI0034CE0790
MLRRLLRPVLRNEFVLLQIQQARCVASKEGKERAMVDEEDNNPITYSTSEAATFQTAKQFTDSRLWYEHWVIHICLACFMGYFFILREENDVDVYLTSTNPFFADYDINSVERERKTYENKQESLKN